MFHVLLTLAVLGASADGPVQDTGALSAEDCDSVVLAVNVFH
jgi:hypothetical protein